MTSHSAMSSLPGPFPSPPPGPIQCDDPMIIESLSKLPVLVDAEKMTFRRYELFSTGDVFVWLDHFDKKLWPDLDLSLEMEKRGRPLTAVWDQIRRPLLIRMFWAGYVMPSCNITLRYRPEPVLCGTRPFLLVQTLPKDDCTSLGLSLRYLEHRGGVPFTVFETEEIVYQFPEWKIKTTGEKFLFGVKHESFLSYGRQKVQVAGVQGIVDILKRPHSDIDELATLREAVVLHEDGTRSSHKVSTIQRVECNMPDRVLKDFDKWYGKSQSCMVIKTEDISLKVLQKFFSLKDMFLVNEGMLYGHESTSTICTSDGYAYNDSSSDDSGSDDSGSDDSGSDDSPTTYLHFTNTRYHPNDFVVLFRAYDSNRMRAIEKAGYRIIWLVDSCTNERVQFPNFFKAYKGSEKLGGLKGSREEQKPGAAIAYEGAVLDKPHRADGRSVDANKAPRQATQENKQSIAEHSNGEKSQSRESTQMLGEKGHNDSTQVARADEGFNKREMGTAHHEGLKAVNVKEDTEGGNKGKKPVVVEDNASLSDEDWEQIPQSEASGREDQWGAFF